MRNTWPQNPHFDKLDTIRSLRVHQNNGVAKNFNHFIRTNCRSRCSSAQRCHGRLRQLRLYNLSSYLELKQELRSISGLLCGLRIMCNFCRLGEWDCEGEVTDSAEKDPGLHHKSRQAGGRDLPIWPEFDRGVSFLKWHFTCKSRPSPDTQVPGFQLTMHYSTVHSI